MTLISLNERTVQGGLVNKRKNPHIWHGSLIAKLKHQNMRKIKIALSLILMTAMVTVASAQKDQFCKVWYNQEKDGKLEVYQVGNTYEAKIVWLKEPNENGKPKVDKNNPDDKLKTRPVIGLVILKGLYKTKDDPNYYDGGKVYDPKNGKTYDCHLTIKGNTAELRGYVLGMSFLGRTSVWTLAEGQ
jgi:uncharacterized protein (DUF2147 family)